MHAALSRIGFASIEKKENTMTAVNVDTDNAGGCTALPRADTVPVAPHILIAEDQPVIQELLRWTLQLAGYRATVRGGWQAALSWKEKAMPSRAFPVVLLLDLILLRVN